jgi:hypothetical protein
MLSAPETAPGIVGIVIGIDVQGAACRGPGRLVRPARAIAFGRAAGWPALRGILRVLVAAIPQPSGVHDYWQIIPPGSVLGLIVGYATQRYGQPSAPARPQRV